MTLREEAKPGPGAKREKGGVFGCENSAKTNARATWKAMRRDCVLGEERGGLIPLEAVEERRLLKCN